MPFSLRAALGSDPRIFRGPAGFVQSESAVFMVISIIAAMNFNKPSRMMPEIEKTLKERRAGEGQ